MTLMKMNKYFGISYPGFLCKNKILELWKRFMCKRNWHLFDEVLSEKHYLSCDACNLMVMISKIDTKYVDPGILPEREET